MSSFEKLFADFYDSVSAQSSNLLTTKALESTKSMVISESHDSLPAGPQEEFFLQAQIRPYFGKPGINNTPIGTHPDFIELEGTDNKTKQHYICTLFIDIKGSTRLTLLYSLKDVFLFKNAVLKTCVEIVRSFDGHVHRLMGDAVMAFFGGDDIDKENAIADAINCSITLRAILEESIKPWMEKKGIDAKDFGFRIGCDFGDDHEILWGSYGYENVGEVSATGLPVDMASKLQGLASKNQTMLGQGLLEYINWPEKYSNIKEKSRDGESVKVPVVTPNLTDSDGVVINYKMRLLTYHNSLEFSALPRSFREKISGSNVIDSPFVKYNCYTIINEHREKYISASLFLQKGISLIFETKVNTNNRLKFPLKLYFTKTNHGKDTPENERGLEQQPEVKQLSKTRTSRYNKAPQLFVMATRMEYTQYRGLHTMKCEIQDNDNNVIFKDWIGVMVK